MSTWTHYDPTRVANPNLRFALEIARARGLNLTTACVQAALKEHTAVLRAARQTNSKEGSK